MTLVFNAFEIVANRRLGVIVQMVS